MTKKVLATLASASVLLAAGSAYAEPPGEGHFANKGELNISADRLFGVSIASAKIEPANQPAQTTSSTAINFLWGSSEAGAGLTNPYAIPRLAFDFAVIDGLLIGGSVGFLSTSGKTENNAGSQNGPSTTTILFAPRAGYVIAFGKHGLWLRGGITYFSASTTTPRQNQPDVKSSLNGFAFNIEPTFVFGVGPNVGFTGGIVIDIPLSGTSENGGVATPVKIMNFGTAFGMLVHF